MKKHFELLGLLYIIFSALNIVAAFLIFIILSSIGFLSRELSDPIADLNGYSAATILNAIGIIIALILVILAIPGLIGGYGLLKKRSWSRILGLILGGLNLMNIPFGTILGIYTLWVLIQDDAINYLDQSNKG